MSYNKVKVVQADTFHGLTSLVRLHMDHNQIEFINPEAFYGLTSLKLVHLEGNLLKQLHPDTFVTLRFLQIFRTSSIKHIYLSDNFLTSLPRDMFTYMSELESLYLHGNSWICDCAMKWFAEWAEQQPGIKCSVYSFNIWDITEGIMYQLLGYNSRQLMVSLKKFKFSNNHLLHCPEIWILQ